MGLRQVIEQPLTLWKLPRQKEGREHLATTSDTALWGLVKFVCRFLQLSQVAIWGQCFHDHMLPFGHSSLKITS